MSEYLSTLIKELQETYDEVGECKVHIINKDSACFDDVTLQISSEYDEYNTLIFYPMED